MSTLYTIRRVLALPAVPVPNTIYFIPDPANASRVKQWIVGADGEARQVVDELNQFQTVDLGTFN